MSDSIVTETNNHEDQLATLEKRLINANAQILSLKEKDNTNTMLLELSKQFPEKAEAVSSYLLSQLIFKSDMELSRAFSLSGAYGKVTAEEAYVKIKTGAEMGLQPAEAMQTFYIVNGRVLPYGDKMLAIITKNGYKMSYINETKDSVTAVATKGDESYSETATSNDTIIKNSKAYKFADKNKLRFHAVRMIASFHLPHLFGSTSDLFSEAYDEYEEVQNNKEEATKKDFMYFAGDHVNKPPF